MRLSHVTTCLLVLAAVCSAGVRAQAQAPAAPEQGGAVLRTTSRLVEVNVIVHNKSGAPIDGLTKDNFAITDQGKPQQIAIFSEQSARDAAGAPALPRDTFANTLAQGGRAPGTATIILFDALNSTLQDQTFGRQQMIKFLQQLQPQDHVAIYLLTTRLQILHEFTYDSRALIRAVGQIHGYSSAGAGDAAADASAPGVQPGDTTSDPTISSDIESLTGGDQYAESMVSFLNGANGQADDANVVNHVQTTAAALEAIAQHVRGVAGRKNLIWLSGSFPISLGLTGDSLTPIDREQRQFTGEIQSATRALNEVNLAVYPIDVRGLTNAAAVEADTAGTFNRTRAPVAPVTDTRPFDTMNEFAERTGGKAYYNGNDLAKAAREVMVDSQLTYQIGFYPTHGKWDGKFHDLKIRLVNVPDANARYRSGYFAVADPPATAQNTKAALSGAVTSPVEFTGLSLQVRVEPSAPATPATLTVDVTIDPRQLLFAQDAGHRKGAVDLLFAQIASGDKLLSADGPHANFDLDQQKYDSLVQTGLILERHLPIAPGAAVLRVVMRDSNSGSMGSVTIPLKSVVPAIQ